MRNISIKQTCRYTTNRKSPAKTKLIILANRTQQGQQVDSSLAALSPRVGK
jgi:hypothetical protein